MRFINNIEIAHYKNSKFIDCIINSYIMKNSSIYKCVLTHSLYAKVNFNNTIFTECKFEKCIIYDCEYRNCVFNKTHFIQNDFYNTEFIDCIFDLQTLNYLQMRGIKIIKPKTNNHSHNGIA